MSDFRYLPINIFPKLPINIFLLENNPYINFVYNEKEIDKSELNLNLSPNLTLSFNDLNIFFHDNSLLEVFKLKEKDKNAIIINEYKTSKETKIDQNRLTNELTVSSNNYTVLSKYKSLLPNAGDFQPFFDYVYDLTQTWRQKIFLKFSTKSYALYSLAFYKSHSNKNKTIDLTLSDLPYIKETTISDLSDIKKPVKQEIVKLNTVYYALNGVRFNTDNKFISTILTEDSLLSMFELWNDEDPEDPLTNLTIEKIDPVLFVLKVSEPQPVPFVVPINTIKNRKRNRSFGGGLKLKKRLKSKSPKKINRKKSLKKKSKKMKR
jgi:hypothetical protein